MSQFSRYGQPKSGTMQSTVLSLPHIPKKTLGWLRGECAEVYYGYKKAPDYAEAG